MEPAEFSDEEHDKAQVSTAEQDPEQTDWRQPFLDFFLRDILPEEKSARYVLRKRALRYVFLHNELYRRMFDDLLLTCLSPQDAAEVMKEVHSGMCGAHQAGPKMKMKLKRMGYYWPTMTQDCMNFARRCHQCQIHDNFIHMHPSPLHPTVASWSFET